MAAEENAKKDSEENETILREMCSVNGINYDKLSQGSGTKVKCLEIFFFGCTRIVELHHFSSLSCLKIVNQRISTMKGVGKCSTLKELWICEGDIEIIEDLEGCPHLTTLYLYSNKIHSMVGIGHLKQLEKLWLNNNRIKKLEDLRFLTNLKDVNMASNEISQIKYAFTHLNKLQCLNLSGNNLSSLEDLTYIYLLTSLQALSLCDPLYPPCPVCYLCNYSSIILYHMPWLKLFDGKLVDSKDLRDLINNLVLKKKQFYRLKIHNKHQMIKQEIDQLSQRLSHYRSITYSRLRILTEHLKNLEDPTKYHDTADASVKINAINNRINWLQEEMLKKQEQFDTEKNLIQDKGEEIMKRWLVELQSGGNIRYTARQDNSGWYKPCLDLVMSRFTISGTSFAGQFIDVLQIIRIENNLLNNKFMDTLRMNLDKKSNSMNSKSSYRDYLDYMFLIWTPNTDFVAIGNHGCGPITPDRPYIKLTNSVNVAEKERAELYGSKEMIDGDLLLCKVYIGDMLEYDGTRPLSSYSPSHCLYQNISPPTSTSSIPQRIYYIFNPNLILPEYLISVSYNKGNNHVNPTDGNIKDTDNDIINLPPCPESKPKLAMLDTVNLLKLSQQDKLENIKELDLSCNRLSRFRFSTSLTSISVLSLSCNELSTVEDFSHMPHLQILNLSFNHLTTLEGLKSLPKLVVLDVSWNSLSYLHHDIGTLKKHTPSLRSLDIRHNDWNKLIDSNLYVLGILRSLQYLDGKAISEKESTNGLRHFALSHLSFPSLLPLCRTDHIAIPSLAVCSIAEQIITNSMKLPVQTTSSSTDWTVQVTAADLSGLQLQKLTCIDHLSNLKWVCLQDNALTNTEGLEFCHKLEEITLDNNYLSHSPSLCHYPNLQWLSIANNQLSSLPLSSSSLSSLTYLNISCNYIKSINGMESLTALQEFYASHNQIESLRQLFVLKLLVNLIIIDFTYNPVSTQESYRLFLIFHISSLKAIDAVPIESNELTMAKDKLGGRLSQDVVYEQYPTQTFESIRKMDFIQFNLKYVDLAPVSNFDNLVSLNLEHNLLTSFSGLIHLNKLKVLCLNHNRIDCLIKQSASGFSTDNTPVLHSLQVLHLAYNSITNLNLFQFHRLPQLKALFLQGNEIARVEGLDRLNQLTELVLDRNKIKSLLEHSFFQTSQLRELHLEENRLCDLSNFYPLKYLERLYLGMNRIQVRGRWMHIGWS
jgi:Leucine-rich repeat (LRR) protein